MSLVARIASAPKASLRHPEIFFNFFVFSVIGSVTGWLDYAFSICPFETNLIYPITLKELP